MSISLYSSEECEQVAKAAKLRYIDSNSPGISRKKRGKGFAYYNAKGELITDEAVVERIKKLAIPPAYSHVWICPYANGHIQAVGLDSRNRKQYRYHPLWLEARQHNKFASMIDFGRALPLIRKHVNENLATIKEINRTQIICTIISLLDSCYIRIGNAIYAKENKSYGLTTLRKKHLSLDKNQAVLNFAGKSAQDWHVVLTDKKIVKILKKCEEIPGYLLFKYYDEHGEISSITSQEINSYLQGLTNLPFTAKDFRTWAACRETLKRLVINPPPENYPTQAYFKSVIKEVADLLGHTPNICQKNYIHNEIINWWKEQKYHSWLLKFKKSVSDLSDDELLLYWLNRKEK